MDVVKENSSLAVESDSVSSHGPEASIPTTVKEAVKDSECATDCGDEVFVSQSERKDDIVVDQARHELDAYESAIHYRDPSPGPETANSDYLPPSGQPRYQQSTHVLPKGFMQDYTNSGSEHIATVFSTGSALSNGIRSLPDALSPDFRKKLFEQIVESGRREVRSIVPRDQPLSYTSQVAPMGLVLPSGQRQVPKIHPYSGSFASYSYLPSEYDRQRIIDKFERLKHKISQVTPSEFVVKAPPPAPKGAPAFSEFQYDLNPNEEDVAEPSTSKAMKVSTGPFLAGGKFDAKANLRGLADECMLLMCKQLSKDWPSSFLQVFEDSSGALVMCFDRQKTFAEGDMSSYMQNFQKSSRIASEFKLVKDGTQWGLLDPETQGVFYVVWPPWVRHRYIGHARQYEEVDDLAADVSSQ